MGRRSIKKGGIPSLEQVKNERSRLKYRARFWKTLRSTISVLLVAAAIAVLISTIWMPVLRIYGSSMSPTINEGEIVITLKGAKFQCGDVIGLYYGNKLLVKRVIAGPGQWVDIAEDGTVTVDGTVIDEPYLTEKAYGDVNIELPYQVPDGRYFVMGDHRSVSSDSRNTSVGCIAEEQIVGKILFCIWPLTAIGTVN